MVAVAMLPNAIVKDVQIPKIHHFPVGGANIKALLVINDSNISKTVTIEYSDVWKNPLLVELVVALENDFGIDKLFNVLSAFSYTFLQSPSLRLTLKLLTTPNGQRNSLKSKRKLLLVHKNQEVMKKLRSAIWLYYNNALVQLRFAISNGDVKLVKAISKILGAVSFYANTSFEETTFFDDCAIGVIKESLKYHNNKFQKLDGVLITPHMYQFKANWFPNYNPQILLEFSVILATLRPLMSNAKRTIRILFLWLDEYLSNLLSTIETDSRNKLSIPLNSPKMPIYASKIRELWLNCPSKCHLPETIFIPEKRFDLENIIQAMYFVLMILLSAIFPTILVMPQGNTKNINAEEYFRQEVIDIAKLSKTKLVMANALEYCWKASTFFYYRQQLLLLLTLTYKDGKGEKNIHPSISQLNLNEVMIVEILKSPIRSFNYPHLPFMIRQSFPFVDEFMILGLEYDGFYSNNTHHYEIFRRQFTKTLKLNLNSLTSAQSSSKLRMNFLKRSNNAGHKDRGEAPLLQTKDSIMNVTRSLRPDTSGSVLKNVIDQYTLQDTVFLDCLLDKANVQLWEQNLFNDYEEFLYSDLISLPLPENMLEEGALKKTSGEPLVAKIKFKEKKAMLSQNLNSALKDFDPSFLLKNVSLFQEEISRIIDVHNIFDELALVRSRSAKLYQSNCA